MTGNGVTQTRTWTYDPATPRLASVTLPATGATSFTCNCFENLTQHSGTLRPCAPSSLEPTSGWSRLRPGPVTKATNIPSAASAFARAICIWLTTWTTGCWASTNALPSQATENYHRATSTNPQPSEGRDMKTPIAVLLPSLSLVCLGIPSQTPSQTSQLEAALFARLRFEILWRDENLNRASTNPARTTAAIWTNGKVLAFCSAELQRCAEYELSGHRLGQRLRLSSTSSKDNWISLQKFVPPTRKETHPEDPGPLFGNGYRGRTLPDSGMTWFAQRAIGTEPTFSRTMPT